MLNKKEKHLCEILKAMKRVLVAFSGGVDSSYLLAIAVETLGKENVLAATISTESILPEDVVMARKLARSLGAKHIILKHKIISVIAPNPPNRCYHCKKVVFGEFIKLARKNKINFVLDGTNADDKKDYRPGTNATAELGVRSPLREAELTKSDIRKLSAKRKLPTAQKLSQACLASRFPYGETITKDKLVRVYQAEKYLRGLGFDVLRVRSHNDIARLEVSEKQIRKLLGLRQKIVYKLKNLGYSYVTVDLQGFRSGSMNEVLK